MSDYTFFLKAIVYGVCFLLAIYSLNAIRFEKLVKPNHVIQAQILYWLLAMSIGYLSASFLLSFIKM